MVSAVGRGIAATKTCTGTAKHAQKLATAAPKTCTVVFGDPHQNVNPPPPGAPGVLKSQIPQPLGPRGFQILNPPPLKGVGAY